VADIRKAVAQGLGLLACKRKFCNTETLVTDTFHAQTDFVQGTGADSGGGLSNAAELTAQMESTKDPNVILRAAAIGGLALMPELRKLSIPETSSETASWSVPQSGMAVAQHALEFPSVKRLSPDIREAGEGVPAFRGRRHGARRSDAFQSPALRTRVPGRSKRSSSVRWYFVLSVQR
jgi:hypothetical protein